MHLGPSTASWSWIWLASLHILFISLLMSSGSPVLCSLSWACSHTRLLSSFFSTTSFVPSCIFFVRVCLSQECQLPSWSYFCTLVMPITLTVLATDTSAGPDPSSHLFMRRGRNRARSQWFKLEITVYWPVPQLPSCSTENKVQTFSCKMKKVWELNAYMRTAVDNSILYHWNLLKE